MPRRPLQIHHSCSIPRRKKMQNKDTSRVLTQQKQQCRAGFHSSLRPNLIRHKHITTPGPARRMPQLHPINKQLRSHGCATQAKFHRNELGTAVRRAHDVKIKSAHAHNLFFSRGAERSCRMTNRNESGSSGVNLSQFPQNTTFKPQDIPKTLG